MEKIVRKIFATLSLVFIIFSVLALSGCGFNHLPSNKSSTLSGEYNVTIIWFHGKGCPHCAAEQVFLSSLINNSHIKIKSYEVFYNQTNREFAEDELSKYGMNYVGVPVTIIGNNTPIIGYRENSDIENQIKSEISNCLKYGCGSPK